MIPVNPSIFGPDEAMSHDTPKRHDRDYRHESRLDRFKKTQKQLQGHMNTIVKKPEGLEARYQPNYSYDKMSDGRMPRMLSRCPRAICGSPQKTCRRHSVSHIVFTRLSPSEETEPEEAAFIAQDKAEELSGVSKDFPTLPANDL